MRRDDRNGIAVTPPGSLGERELLGILVAAAVVAALYFAREVLIPVASAILLAFVLAPLMRLLRKVGVPRAPAALIAVTLSLLAIIGVAAAVASQLSTLTEEVPGYTTTVRSKLDALGGVASGGLVRLATRTGIQLSEAGNETVAAAGLRPAKRSARPVPVEVHQPAPSSLQLAQQYLGPLLKPLATLALVFVVAVFILLQQTDARDRLIRLFGSTDLLRTTEAMDDAGRRLSRYFLTQLAVNVVFGIVVGLGLHVIGVPHALLWGGLSTLLRFAPIVGGVISAALPTLLAAAVDPGWVKAAETLGFIVVLELGTGQFIEPLLYGNSTGLSPLAVLVAAIFWSWIWGPMGLLLSTPVSLCLVVLGRHIPRLQALEVLLGDRPPLTPAETLYQRLLAGDTDEALEQAERLLEGASLSAYYDQVALESLRLAHHDSARGVLKPHQKETLRTAFLEVVAELGTYEDVEAPSAPASPAGAADAVLAPCSPPQSLAFRRGDPRPEVVCLARRGVWEGAANAILMHLLRAHGLTAREAPLRSLTAEAREEDAKVAAVVVSTFAAAAPTSLNVVHASIRARWPGAQVIIAAWNTEVSRKVGDASEPDAAFVSTLREVVDAAVGAAAAWLEARPGAAAPSDKETATVGRM